MELCYAISDGSDQPTITEYIGDIKITRPAYFWHAPPGAEFCCFHRDELKLSVDGFNAEDVGMTSRPVEIRLDRIYCDSITPILSLMVNNSQLRGMPELKWAVRKEAATT